MIDRIFDTIVIWAWPAWVSAASYTKRKGLSTLLISKNFWGQILYTSRIFSNISAEHWIGTKELVKRYKNAIEYEHVEFVLDEVVSVLQDKKRKSFVVKTAKKDFFSKTIIIATGRLPKHIPLPYKKGGDFSKLQSFDFLDYPYDGLKKKQEVLILWWWYVWLDVAEELHKYCKNIYIVEKTGKLWGNARRQQEVSSLSNVTLFMNSTLKEILNQDKKYYAIIKTPDWEQKISIDGLYISVWTVPNAKIFKGKKTSYGEIKTLLTKNRKKMTMTSINGIFACWDCVETTEYWFEPLAIWEWIRCAKTVCNFLWK